MSSTAAQANMGFDEATKVVRTLTRKPDNSMLLKLYGLFKQATIGNVNTSQPWAMQIEARAKWDAWNGYQNLPKDKAQKQYVDLVLQLLKTHKK